MSLQLSVDTADGLRCSPESIKAIPEIALIRLGKKSPYWAELSPIGRGTSLSWQLQITSRGRGQRILSVVLEATPLRPIASVTLSGETYPLHIQNFQQLRGGGVMLTGERRIGTERTLNWQCRWSPTNDLGDSFELEFKVKTSPQAKGTITIELHTPPAALQCLNHNDVQRCGITATAAWSAYSKQLISIAAADPESEQPEWDERSGKFRIVRPNYPFGGKKSIRLSLYFSSQESFESAGDAFMRHLAAVIDFFSSRAVELPKLDPKCAAGLLLVPERVAPIGVQRLHMRALELKEPHDFVYAGAPFYPLEALAALWNWGRLHPDDCIAKTVRFAALGVSSDFQIMGRGDGDEPNKGAFWDRRTADDCFAHDRTNTLDIASNARMAVALFSLYDALGEGFCRQSALNVCHWLLLKLDLNGSYKGARCAPIRKRNEQVLAAYPSTGAEAAEALRAFVHAFRATRTEVWINAAWKVMNHLLQKFASGSVDIPLSDLARFAVAVADLDFESASPKLRKALNEWAGILRVQVLAMTAPETPVIAGTEETDPIPDPAPGEADNLATTDERDATPSEPVVIDPNHPDWIRDMERFSIADACLRLHAIQRDARLLECAWSILGQCRPEFLGEAWPSISIWNSALLSVAALCPDSIIDFDGMTVTLGWRQFAPEPMVMPYIDVAPGEPGSGWVMSLPLVCRSTDQMLLIVITSSKVGTVTVLKNGRKPLVCDQISKSTDEIPKLHAVNGSAWGKVGIWLINP